MEATLKIVVVVVCLLVSGAEGTAHLTPGSSGEAVTNEAINAIEASPCFTANNGFLYNTAEIESYFGTHPDTYRSGFHGGIWQVYEAMFDVTQDTVTYPDLIPIHSCISTEFTIVWTTVTWVELRRPLYSGIAAMLFLSTVQLTIPSDLEAQGDLWLAAWNPNPIEDPIVRQERRSKTFWAWVHVWELSGGTLPNGLPDPFTSGAQGETVTCGALDTIVDRQCFPEMQNENHVYDFMKCLAWVESRYGSDIRTYRNLPPPPFHGGIWQVTQAMLDSTRNPVPAALAAKLQCLEDDMGIDWDIVTWPLLRQPLFSALAAMLFACTKPAIPMDEPGQCQWWVDHWTRGDAEDIIITQARRNVFWWSRLILFKGDPHMEQLLPGSKTPLCYDIIGDEGDVYSLYTNPETNVEVNIRLTGIRKGDKGIYIGEVILMVGNTQIEVTLGSVSFNGEPKQMWMTQNWHDANKTAEVTIEARKMVVDVGFTQIRILKNRRWLDVEMSQTGSFGQNDGGVFGFLGNHAQVVEHNLGANLIVTNVDQNTTDVYSLHSKPHHCWRIFKRGHDDFSQFLKNHIIKCPTC